MLNGMIDLKTVIKPYLSSDNLVAKLDFYYGDRSYSDSELSLKVHRSIKTCRIKAYITSQSLSFI